MKKKGDISYGPIINDIFESVVCYSGFTFSSKFEASKKWKEGMVIFLDTEILFHMAGYNGLLYKKLFDDFYELVQEINSDSIRKNGKKLLHLKYFKSVEGEINQFFDAAKDIVIGKQLLIPSVMAMNTITNGCRTEGDILLKRGIFNDLLKKKGIEIDANEAIYYAESSYKFNTEDESIIKAFKKEYPSFSETDIRDSLASLSHINVLRKGFSKCQFERVRYVLLTDNYITKRLSWFPMVKSDDSIPCSTDMYFITNRFWYKLGKGLGRSEDLNVLDISNKARIILSEQISNSVYSTYSNLKEKYDAGEITPDAALEYLSLMKDQIKAPEKIDSSAKFDEVEESIAEKNLSQYIAIAEERKATYEKANEENCRLKADYSAIRESNDEYIKENKELSDENTAVKKQLSEIKNDVESISSQYKATFAEKEEYKSELNKHYWEEYKKELNEYKKQRNSFVKKKYKKALGFFISVPTLLIITIGVSVVLSNDNCKILNNINNWVKASICVLIGQFFPWLRYFISKDSIKQYWQIVRGKQKKMLLDEFNHTMSFPIRRFV